MNSERQTARLKRRAERLGPPSRTHNNSISRSINANGFSNDAGSVDAASSSVSSSRARGANFPPTNSSSDSVQRPSAAPIVNDSYASRSIKTAGINTRRVKSPRDINVLVDKLLIKVHGKPSPMTTRRAVIQLHDSMSVIPEIDASLVLEKMKRKIALDSERYYKNPHETVERLNEIYSRVVKFKNLDRKTEALLLLYGLMDSVTPPEQTDHELTHTNFATKGMDKNVGHRSLSSQDSIVSNGNALGVGDHHRSQSMPTTLQNFEKLNPASASNIGHSKTDLDSLEDSFKFAVGIAPTHKTSRGRGTSPRMPSSAHTRAGGSSATNSFSNITDRSFFDVPEEVLLRDVLYALQAIESRYLYFDDAIDRFQITRSAGVPTPMRELVYVLCELGWLYRKISEYIKQHREALAFGLVGQSFCHVLNTELVAYFRLIAILAAQIDEDAEIRQPKERKASSLTLRTLIVWTQDSLDKMRLMARLIDSVEGLRGGALASGIHSHVLHGDPDVSESVQAVLKQIAAPIVRMIKRWVFKGELEDVHGEFFVVADSSVSDDQFWAKKYTLNLKMLPAFISMYVERFLFCLSLRKVTSDDASIVRSSELAKKILIIGKSINFIRQCCGNADWVMDAALETAGIEIEMDEAGSNFAELRRLEQVVEDVSNATNKYLIRTLMEKYRLLDHCQALKRYLLLGQGDFVQYLMDLLGPELSKRGSQVYRHTLTNVLETALNASNAKFEPADILGRIDVELLQGSSADTGWDIFCLHYNLQTPVNSVIPASSMLQYKQIFDFLWRMKRVEHSLSASWTKDMSLGNEVQGCLQGIRPILHRGQLVRSKMIHFITNLLNYIMFEVLETAWHQLVKNLKAAKDLDELIESHATYINSIKRNGFMMKEERNLLKQLKLLFSTIIRFCKAQKNLYTTAMHEKHVAARRLQVDQRQELDDSLEGIAEEEDYKKQDAFGSNSKILRHIEEISDDFSSQFLKLLGIIKQDSMRGSQNLLFLMSRFDFNEFYCNNTVPLMDTAE